MARTIYIVMHSDIMNYPPMISLIEILKELGENIVYIGDYSETSVTNRFRNIGIELVKIIRKKANSSFSIVKSMYEYRNKLSNYLKRKVNAKEDVVWYVFCDNAPAVHDIISKYKYLIHYYEFDKVQFNWKFKLLFSSFKHDVFAKKALTTIHCEYNRAQIFRGLMGLDYIPFIIPNKPYFDESIMDINLAPDAIKETICQIRNKIKGKKVILYQGIFDSRERRLEEFCQAIQEMTDDYFLIAMGRGDNSFEQLKKKYESNKIFFIPFIVPPFHLFITQLASVGVLSYSPINNTINGVINPLYCAPNKIFEYGRYGKPMIANDVPGLRNIFDNYKCGEIVCYPLTAQNIKNKLVKLFDNYDTYSKGSLDYYNSVDLKKIMEGIIKTIEEK